MRRPSAAACFIVVVLSAFVRPGPGVAAETATVEGRLANIAAVPPTPRLGLAFPGNFVNYPVLGEIGVGVVRLSAAWKRLERSPGQYEWSTFDKQIRMLQNLGIEPFLTFESNAPWAVRRNTSSLVNGTPKDKRQWQRFVRAVVERYDGDGKKDASSLLRPVRYFQVANEWLGAENRAGGWLGTTDELIEFINLSHDTVKEASPKAIFVHGGIASGQVDRLVLYEKGTECLRQPDLKQCPHVWQLIGSKGKYIRHQGEKATRVLGETRYDVADLHLYGRLEYDLPRIQTMRNMSGNRPLLSSECGGPSLIKRGDTYRPEDHFIAALGRNLTALSEGLAFCLWFRIAEGRGGSRINKKVPLIDTNRQPKPGFQAYKLLAIVLEGAERVERRGDNIFVIHRKHASPLVVAWKDKGDKRDSIMLPPEASGEVLHITDLANATYVIEAVPSQKASLPLSQLPWVAGKKLPKALYPSR